MKAVTTIAALTDLVRAGDGNEAERIRLMEAREQALGKHLAKLAQAREVITERTRTTAGT